jgi:RHS repeat-associated protein
VLVKQTTGSQTDKTIYIGGYFEVFIKTSYTPPTTPPAPNCGVRRCVYFPLGIVPNNPPATTGQVWKSYYSTGSGRVMRVQDNTNTGGSGGLFWLYADHLGSTTLTARLDGLGGDLISTLSYTAWGETRSSTGTTPTSIRYTGQREAEAGLYFYQARWYDPSLGRFAQADTIIPGQDAVAFDRYSYANNNPLKYKDPSGHWFETAFDVASLLMSLNDVRTEGLNFWTGLSVVTDAASIILPMVPAAASHAIRAAKAADKALDTAKAADKIVDTAKTADKIADTNKATLYAIGNASGPRPPRIEGFTKPGQQPDILVDAFGNVVPGVGGASTFETIKQLKDEGLKGHVWELPGGSQLNGFDDIPDGIPYGDAPFGHHSLVPNTPMTPKQCIECFSGLPWKPVMNKSKQLKLE